ncbi:MULTISPECIES: hypothetical protein [unclassified Exiguobacterium]|uniref:hypothetical protein n=1 Tax=unclassified Exiguobacterium TaxID=2644629 RepID=UPI001BE9CEFB|nr:MULTISPECIES: hypothetical protein [unclassified Exiguobacterium]
MSKLSSYNRPATGLTGKPAVKQEVMTWRPPGMTPPYNERLAQERAKHQQSTKQTEKDVAQNA